MRRPFRDFRILDKDLERVSNAETVSTRFLGSWTPVFVALFLILTATLAASGLVSGSSGPGILIMGVAVAGYLALSMGGNDAANSLGPAVGAGAIGVTTGLFLVGLMQVAGAVFAGAEVTERLSSGLILISTDGDQVQAARIMVAALLAAGTWISLATWVEAPVSTTHSLVGAIIGAGAAVMGWGAVNWTGMATIATGWVIAPLVAGVIAAGLLAFLRRRIFDAANPLAAALHWMPPLVALTVGLFTEHLLYDCIGFSQVPSVALAVVSAVAAFVWTRLNIRRQIALAIRPGAAIKAMLNPPLIVSAMMMGFAHGSNDASNVTAPLAVILQGTSDAGQGLGPWTPLLAGLGIAAGAVLFGRRLVHMVGSKITRLTQARAFCVTLATAITVIAASAAGLPLSTTHVAVGAVFGVGFYREWQDRRATPQDRLMPVEERRRRHLVRRSYVRTVFGAWLITVPVAAALGATATLIIR